MGYDILQGNTVKPLQFKLVSSSDHVTGMTGLAASLAANLRKVGGGWGAPAGAITEVNGTNNGKGWYEIAPNATDANTLGPLLLEVTCAGCDPCSEQFLVVAFNDQDGAGFGLSRVDGSITSRQASGAAVTLPAIPADWIAAAGVKADAVTKIQAGLSTYGGADTSGTTTLLNRLTATRAGYLDGLSAGVPTAAAIADAVFDELLSGHTIIGSAGAALAAAGAAGDPLSIVLPGPYTGQQAGNVLWTLQSSGKITLVSPIIDSNGYFEIKQGGDYLAADNRAITFTLGSSPDLTGAAVKLIIEHYDTSIVIDAVITGEGTSSQAVSFDVPSDQTSLLTVCGHNYDIKATLANNHVVPLGSGIIEVSRQLPEPENQP